MNKTIVLIIKSILGIVWVLIFSVIGIMIFMDLDTATQKIIVSENVKILPKFTGGEVANSSSNAEYTRLIHKPVDDFIQIDWLAEQVLPKEIKEDIDFNQDGRLDLKINIDTERKTVVYEKLSDESVGLMKAASLADFKARVSKNEKDSLFFYSNHKYKQMQYGEGVSIRILKKLPKN